MTKIKIDYHFHPNLPKNEDRATEKCKKILAQFEKKKIDVVIITEHAYKNPKRAFNFLNKHNIGHIRQKTFEGCVDIYSLRFDFYIPQLNICIEYDGLQHYVGWNYDSESLLNIKRKDYIKNEFCEKNNITLIRIPYTDVNNAEYILNNLIK